jgi:phosphomannomutase
MATSRKLLCLFDVDGTLTPSRQIISDQMESFLGRAGQQATLGIVGGSDIDKIAEQMGGRSSLLERFHYVFSENGLVAHKQGVLIHQQNIAAHLGEDKTQSLINFALRYMSELVLPVKRGTFVEFRSGLINFCPVGRSCSQAQRDAFAAYDQAQGVRAAFKAALEKEFGDLGLRFVIGGQISIDAFPDGWDKRYCLQFVEQDFDEIHFFGDKTEPGGNDYEIFTDSRTVGHRVTGPEDTMEQVKALLGLE